MEKRGKDGLSEDEVAFYEALSENDSAVDVMSDDKLKLIAQELLQSVRSKATIDWHHSDMARATIRVAVKRILKRNMATHLIFNQRLFKPCCNRPKPSLKNRPHSLLPYIKCHFNESCDYLVCG